jgi:Skp family chaperone for outer membrane proteins
MQNLAGFNWSWLNFIKPLLNAFLNAGYAISQEEVRLFNAVFEYKYGIAIILFFTIYFVAQGLQMLFQALENLYSDGRRLVKKIQEDNYNKALTLQNTIQQEQIKNYLSLNFLF